MQNDHRWLGAEDIRFALLRYHLLFSRSHIPPQVYLSRGHHDRAVVLVAENELDQQARLVIGHGTAGGAILQLLRTALVPRKRYLFIVPGEIRKMLLRELLFVEYSRHCLLYTCQELRDRAQPEVLVRVKLRGGCYAYRYIVNGRWVSEARVNWQTECFAEVGVYTRREYRGRGLAKDAVHALTKEILLSGRRPLYVVERHNAASISVCRSLGYENSGIAEFETVAQYFPNMAYEADFSE